jgi:hypothetical protein
MTRFHLWKRHLSDDPPVTPDPEAVEALRVQRVKRMGAEARRQQAAPIVAASTEIWERNHLAESLVAAAHRIVEGP